MPEPRLISSYLAVLAAQLPAPIVEELADGLTETHRSYLRQGLAPDLAAESAVAEFGEPQVIVAGFARVNPARRAARRLLGIGRPSAPAGSRRCSPAGPGPSRSRPAS